MNGVLPASAVRPGNTVGLSIPSIDPSFASTSNAARVSFTFTSAATCNGAGETTRSKETVDPPASVSWRGTKDTLLAGSEKDWITVTFPADRPAGAGALTTNLGIAPVTVEFPTPNKPVPEFIASKADFKPAAVRFDPIACDTPLRISVIVPDFGR